MSDEEYDDSNDGHWNDENEPPEATGWYLCDAIDQRWGPGVFKYRAWGRGYWWIPLPDGWLSSPIGTYRWCGPAYDINGPSPDGADPKPNLTPRGKR